MTLDEIILSEKILFTAENKLREGGKKFLEHISKYAKKVVILGFKSIYAEQIAFYAQNHKKDANLVLNSDSELTYHILQLEDVNLEKCIYVASTQTEVLEAEDCKIPHITFNYPKFSKPHHNFNSLKDITRYFSTFH